MRRNPAKLPLLYLNIRNVRCIFEQYRPTHKKHEKPRYWPRIDFLFLTGWLCFPIQ